MPNPEMKTLTVGENTFDIRDGRIGDLADLDTTDKSSVVAAINEAAQGGGTAGQFYATYDETTSAEIEAAYQAGKIVACKYSDRVYYLGYRGSATAHGFYCVIDGTSMTTVYRVYCNNGTWTNSSHSAIRKPSSPATGNVLKYDSSDWVAADLSASDVGAEPATTEVTIPTAGAVTQALDAGKIYHFTGALTALTITLNAAASGQIAHYHFDFACGSTAPTVTIPATVTMPDSNSFDASKRYEVDILNNYGAVMAWANS